LIECEDYPYDKLLKCDNPFERLSDFSKFVYRFRDTTGHQMTIQVRNSPDVCFALPGIAEHIWNGRWNEQQTSYNRPDWGQGCWGTQIRRNEAWGSVLQHLDCFVYPMCWRAVLLEDKHLTPHPTMRCV